MSVWTFSTVFFFELNAIVHSVSHFVFYEINLAFYFYSKCPQTLLSFLTKSALDAVKMTRDDPTQGMYLGC